MLQMLVFHCLVLIAGKTEYVYVRLVEPARLAFEVHIKISVLFIISCNSKISLFNNKLTLVWCMNKATAINYKVSHGDSL